MNLENLKNTWPALLEGMKNNRYNRTTCCQIRKVLEFLIENIDNSWATYDEAYKAFKEENQHLKPKTLRGYSSAFFHIENFDLNGIIPEHEHKWPDSKRTAKYLSLNQEFKNFIDFSCKQGKAKGLAESTLKIRWYVGSAFLKEMMDLGRNSLAEIREEDILSYCLDEEDNPKRGAGTIVPIGAVFDYGLEFNPEECIRIRNLLPKPRQVKKNQPVFRKGDVGRIKEVLEDENSPLDYRARALASFLLYTGARAGEAANLEFPDVDFDNDLISYVQGKNKARVERPLNAKLKKALLDYIEKQRPETDSQKIFQSKGKKPKDITYDTIWHDINKVYNAAQIRRHNKKRGSHMFRRNFATVLMDSGRDRAEISQLLGHTNLNSIEPYLSADFENLKKCALSVEMFPVDPEVFDV